MGIQGQIYAEGVAVDVIRMIDEEIDKEPPGDTLEILLHLRDRVIREIRDPASVGYY